MKYFLLSFLTTISLLAYGDAVIFSGADVLTLKPNIDLFRTSKLMGLSVDPRAGAGVAAPLSSIGMDYLTGNVYYKYGAADTQWKSISDAITGTPFQYAGFDVNGDLSDTPGVSYTENATQSYGMIINKAVLATTTDIQGVNVNTQVDGATAATDYSSFGNNTQFGNSVATVVNQIHPFTSNNQYFSNLTASGLNTFQDQSNVVDAAITDITSFNTGMQVNTTTLNTITPLRTQVNVGSASATHVNGFSSLGIFDTMSSLADLDGYTGLNVSPSFQTGSVVDGYTGIYHNPQIDSIGINGYRGFQLGANIGQNAASTVNNHIDMQIVTTYRNGSTLGDYSGINVTPSFEAGSTVTNGVQNIYGNAVLDGQSITYFGNVIMNNSFGNTLPTSIGNYQEANFNPNFNANTTINNYNGIVVRPNTAVGSSITNDVTMLDLAINAPIPVGNAATGINVDMTNFQTGLTQQKKTFNGQGGSFSNFSSFNTSVLTPVVAFGNNILGGDFTIAAGSPVSGVFGFGNNLGIGVDAQDDMAADLFLGSSSIGYSINGFVNQAGVAAGKTFDTLNYMFAGGSFPASSTGGTVTNLAMFRAVGLVNGGGTLNITNEIQFQADAAVDLGAPTNLWAFRADSTNADNWFAKNLVVGGATMKPTNSSVGVEVAGTTKALLQSRLTTAQRLALTAVNGMQVYDTDLNAFYCYANGAWAACAASTPSLSVQTANYTVLPSDSTILADASGGLFTLTLPSAVGLTGKTFTFKKIDTSTNRALIAPNGAETIDGLTSVLIMGNYLDNFQVVSDGSNWFVTDDDASVIASFEQQTAQNIPDSTLTIVDYADQVYNPQNMVSTGASWNSNPTRPGYYLVKATVTFSTDTVGQRDLFIYKNGSVVAGSEQPPSATSGWTYTAHAIVYLNGSSDYVDARIQQNSGVTQATFGGATYNRIDITRVR